MVNSPGERKDRHRIYKKTRVVRSSNTEEGETEALEEARQIEVEMERQ
jgi:hypothetical protein